MCRYQRQCVGDQEQNMRVTKTVAAGRFIPNDVPFIALALCAAFFVLAAIPIWFEQSMMFSAMVGRTEPQNTKAAIEFSCRAHFVFWVGCSIAGIWVIVRWAHLHVARAFSHWIAVARAILEFLLAILLCWLVEFMLSRHEPFRAFVEAFAQSWCSGTPK